MTTKENTRTIKVKCTLYIPVVVPNDPDLDWELCIEERGCPGTGRVGDAIKEYIEKCEKEGVCWGCPGRNEIMETAEYAPVQPAPAEKEDEWWREYQAAGVVADRKQWVVDESDIGPLISEAKRRGAEEAWREAKDIIRDRAFQMDCGSAEEHQMKLFSKINAKLESLNNPAGAGEK